MKTKKRQLVFTRRNRSFASQNGFALAGILLFTLIASLFASAVLNTLSVHGALIQDDYNYTRALYTAESGLNRASEALWIGFRNAGPNPGFHAQWVDRYFRIANDINIPVGVEGDTYTVSVRAIIGNWWSPERMVVLEAGGNTVGGLGGTVQRKITRVMRYGHDQSCVFDYSYFTNNFGWFRRFGLTVNGDVRANGDITVTWPPVVNGNMYAGINPDIGASGSIR